LQQLAATEDEIGTLR